MRTRILFGRESQRFQLVAHPVAMFFAVFDSSFRIEQPAQVFCATKHSPSDSEGNPAQIGRRGTPSPARDGTA
jgi:hypothetical protein